MRRTIFAFGTIVVVFVAVFAVLVLRPVSRVKAQPGCSNGTLFGNFGYTLSLGQEGPNGGPLLGVGIAQFDGNGGYTTSQEFDASKFRLSGPNTSTGTYEVNPDCSLSFTTDNGSGYGVVVDAIGGEVDGILFFPSTTTPPTAPNAAQGTITLKRVWGSH